MKNATIKTPNMWKNLQFDQVINEVIDFRGKTPKKLGMDWGNGNIRALSANNVKKGYIDFNSECHLASEDLYQKWMHKGDLKKGDIVFTMEAPLGNVAQIPDDNKYLLSQRVVAFKTHKNCLNDFLFHLLLSDSSQNKIALLSTGSTAQGVNQKSLSKISFLLPPIPEQQRIVEVLETWDKYLERLNNQIKLKRAAKKSLASNLLTGKIRLHNFNIAWKKTKLANIASFYKGNGLPKSSVDSNGKYECILYGELFIKYKEVAKSYYSKTNNTEAMRSKYGDILIPASDVTPFGLGTATTVMHDNILIGGDINIIRPYDNVNPIFISYLLNHEKRKIIELVTGTTIRHIYLSDIKKINIVLPTFEEQTVVAEILSKADEEIEGLEKKRKLILEQKKFLLNNLITGKIRLPEFRDKD